MAKAKEIGEIRIGIDDIPPDMNHYIRHTRNGHHYKTREASGFQSLVAISAGKYRNAMVEAKEIHIFIYLPPKKRGDVDNFPKVVLDALVLARVIRSDSSIVKLIVEKARAALAHTTILILWEK
jgi:crossover junction endodeoxyribonuclease RusA